MEFFNVSNPLIPALGWTLIHAVWQIAVVGLVLRLLLSLVSVKRANVRYVLSVSALVTVCLWTVVGLYGHYHFFKKNPLPITQNEAAALTSSEGVTAANLTIFLETKEPTLFTTATISDLLDRAMIVLSNALNACRQFCEAYLFWLVLFWAMGVLLLGGRFLVSWGYLYYLAHHRVQAVSEQWQDRLVVLKKQLKIRQTVQLLESALVKSPLTFGHFKPVILVPAALFSGLSPEQIESVLLHELAHIRRADYVVNLFQSWVEIVLFFHPVIWWMSATIRQEREYCCDDVTILTCQNPHLYAQALTQLQRFSLTSTINLTMNVSPNKGQLTARIYRLLDYTSQKTPFSKGMAVLWTGLVLLTTCIGIFAFTGSTFDGSPTISAAADRMNILYAGIENPVTIAVEGVPNEEVSIQSAAAEIQKDGDGHYILIPKEVGVLAVEVMIGGQKNHTVSFKVKQVPAPLPTIGGHTGGQMTVAEMQATKGLYSVLNDFEFPLTCETLSFDFTWATTGRDLIEIKNEGEAFNAEIQAIFQQLTVKDILYFDNIMAMCPGDAEARTLPTISFRIK